MAPSPKTPSDKPSLEELLRFKRAEKPDQAFWGRFDNELHQRMMQTLVKKDPWPVQVMRALSGRIAQTAGVFGAAALLAFAIIQPGLISVSDHPHALELAQGEPLVHVESAIPAVELPVRFSAADYRIDTVSTANLVASNGVSSEYHLDSIQLANFSTDVYRTESVISGGGVFASTGAALIF